MIQNETKSPEILKAERQVEQAKARLAEAKRKESAKKRSDENKHKYMMGGIVHKYFPECYGFDEYECQLESEPRARLILSHLCSFESEPPKHRSSNDPDGRSPHSYLGHRI